MKDFFRLYNFSSPLYSLLEVPLQIRASKSYQLLIMLYFQQKKVAINYQVNGRETSEFLWQFLLYTKTCEIKLLEVIGYDVTNNNMCT